MFGTKLILESGGEEHTLLAAIQAAAQTADLELCLDAGDGDSYTAGATWSDVSGNGYDFDFGAGAAAPTFTGTPDGQSSGEYMAFDGGDHFTYDSANEAWMKDMNKQGNSFTALFVYYLAATAADPGLWGTRGAGGDNGNLFYFSTAKMRFVQDAGATNAHIVDNTTSTGAWHSGGVVIDEAVGGQNSFFFENGAYKQVGAADKFDANYGADADPAYVMQLGAGGNDAQQMDNGNRLAAVAFWSRALTLAEVNSVISTLNGWRSYY